MDLLVSGKRLELLKEIFPTVSRVAVLWDPNGPGSGVGFKEYEVAAKVFKLHLQSLELRGPTPDLEAAFRAAKKDRAGALIIVANPLTFTHQTRIIELANRNGFPSMYEDVRF